MRRTSLTLLALAALAGGPITTLAQTGGGAPQRPVETLPLPPPAAPPAGASPANPAPPAAAGRPTLIPTPGDPVNVDEVTLPAKPAAVYAATSTWDEGFQSLKTAFARIEQELARANLAPAGRPLAVFLETDDLGFRYEAMVPLATLPEGRAALGQDVRFGRTPEGKALRFAHEGPYDDIDSTYETITAYLDAKSVQVKDSFVEEYVTDLTEAADDALKINVFALPR